MPGKPWDVVWVVMVFSASRTASGKAAPCFTGRSANDF